MTGDSRKCSTYCIFLFFLIYQSRLRRRTDKLALQDEINEDISHREDADLCTMAVQLLQQDPAGSYWLKSGQSYYTQLTRILMCNSHYSVGAHECLQFYVPN